MEHRQTAHAIFLHERGSLFDIPVFEATNHARIHHTTNGCVLGRGAQGDRVHHDVPIRESPYHLFVFAHDQHADIQGQHFLRGLNQRRIRSYSFRVTCHHLFDFHNREPARRVLLTKVYETHNQRSLRRVAIVRRSVGTKRPG
jgi:hypothetical protein